MNFKQFLWKLKKKSITGVEAQREGREERIEHQKYRTMKKLIFSAMSALLLSATFAQNMNGEIIGKVIDGEDNQPLYGVRVWVEVGDSKLLGMSNIEGRYRISAVPPGTYTVFLAYKKDTVQVANQFVKPDGICSLPEFTFSNTLETSTVYIETYREPLIHIGNEGMCHLSPADIKVSINRQDVLALIENMSSDIQKTSSGELIIRGSRPGDVIYFVDGIKTDRLGTFPGSSIGGVTVYTGGIPAKYGDTTGGVVILETNSYFDLYRAWKLSTGK